MISQAGKRVKWNSSNFIWILAIYVAVIGLSAIYFFVMQGFGSHGLTFSIGGRDNTFTAFDAILVAATAISFFLVALSLLAFKRKKDNRIFILSLAFFFFALHEVVQIFDAFYPQESIFIENATRVLDLLVLASLMMLLYSKFSRR
jgi:hypothetical protein